MDYSLEKLSPETGDMIIFRLPTERDVEESQIAMLRAKQELLSIGVKCVFVALTPDASLELIPREALLEQGYAWVGQS